MKQPHQATKTRSNRPGWSVTFKHPKRSDSRGKPGLKLRKGLGTKDDAEADRLVAQLNTLLSDERWWSNDRRTEAGQQFDSVIVSVFYDGMEAGKHNSQSLREQSISLPGQEEGYSRILFTGTTGAGKTTLLRQIIGSRHEQDRFPSTSTARTTTAEIEIVTADSPFEAAITFMPEHEVRAHVDECIEEACLKALDGKPPEKVVAELLAHREQRFRLSYVLGAWGQQVEKVEEDDFSFDDEDAEINEISSEETVTLEEIQANGKRLGEYLSRIQKLAADSQKSTQDALELWLENLEPDDRAAWLEVFAETLYEHEDFSKLALDLMEDVQTRFEKIEEGEFQNGSTGWPLCWTFSSEDRDTFLRQVRWFSSNHHAQYGRLLTPLVDGVRVKGPFGFRGDEDESLPKLVLLDGEGIGHSAKAASSISTRITRRFAESDLILIVDNAEQPMQAAPLELLRSIGTSGNASKMAVAFTHFDLVKGVNLRSHELKREHVLSSVRDAIGSIRDAIGASVAGMLESRIENAAYYLGGLDREITKIPKGFRTELRSLLDAMQESGAPAESIDLKPIYTGEGLEIALSDAVKEFRNPWQARLGFIRLSDFPKEHWTRVKALAKRLALGWNNNEYDNLRPVADLVSKLQESISRWLDQPADWSRLPLDDAERNQALDPIRNGVFQALQQLSEARVAEMHRADWTMAFDYSGSGSSYKRADEIQSIYDEAAPTISSAMSSPARDFVKALHKVVREAVTEEGGRFRIGSEEPPN